MSEYTELSARIASSVERLNEVAAQMAELGTERDRLAVEVSGLMAERERHERFALSGEQPAPPPKRRGRRPKAETVPVPVEDETPAMSQEEDDLQAAS